MHDQWICLTDQDIDQSGVTKSTGQSREARVTQSLLQTHVLSHNEQGISLKIIWESLICAW